MKTSEIRTRLKQYIETVEDKKVKAIYALVEEDIEDKGAYYSPALKAELDSRYEEYKNGGKLISEATVNKRIGKIIKSKVKNKLYHQLSAKSA